MHRTQIYLPQSQFQILQNEAHRQGVSLSEIIRNVLQRYLQIEGKIPPKKSQGPNLVAMAKRMRNLGEVGPADLASNVDKYMYGDI